VIDLWQLYKEICYAGSVPPLPPTHMSYPVSR